MSFLLFFCVLGVVGHMGLYNRSNHSLARNTARRSFLTGMSQESQGCPGPLGQTLEKAFSTMRSMSRSSEQGEVLGNQIGTGTFPLRLEFILSLSVTLSL